MAPLPSQRVGLLRQSSFNATADASQGPANHPPVLQVIVALTSLQTGLAHVQSGLNDLLRTYMQHTSSILAGEEGDLDKLQLPANLTATANAAMEAALGAANGVAQGLGGPSHADGAGAAGKNKKRKREKKERDPNAPKKPLTAAFLYAQSARPIVRADLEKGLGPGDALEKNAVNLETTQRWNNLSEEEKDVSTALVASLQGSA